MSVTHLIAEIAEVNNIIIFLVTIQNANTEQHLIVLKQFYIIVEMLLSFTTIKK